MKSHKKQVGGTHYIDMPVQPWEVMREAMGDYGFAYYLLGNIVKYRMRAGRKEGTDDAAKAEHYAEVLQELIDYAPLYEIEEVKEAWVNAEKSLTRLDSVLQ